MGSRFEVATQRWLGRGAGGRAQVFRGQRERTLILQAVGHGRELAVETASDGRKEARRLRTHRPVEPVEPGGDLVPGRVGRVEIGGRGFVRGSRHERPVVFDTRPGSLVEEEEIESGLARCTPVAEERQQQGGVAGPHLLQEEAVHHARRVHDMGQRLPFGDGEVREISTDFDRSEQSRHGGFLLSSRCGAPAAGEDTHEGGDGDRREATGPTVQRCVASVHAHTPRDNAALDGGCLAVRRCLHMMERRAGARQGAALLHWRAFASGRLSRLGSRVAAQVSALIAIRHWPVPVC